MKKSSIKINVLYQFGYELFAMLIPLVTAPYVSRVLGAERLGIYSWCYSVASYFGLAAMLGVKNYGNREIARNRGDQESLSKTFWSIYAVQCSVSLAALAAYLLTVCFLPIENKTYLLVFTVYVLSCLLDISWFFFGIEQFKVTSVRNTLVKFGTAALVFLSVREKDDLMLYCAIMAGGCLASQLILWMQMFRYVRFAKVQWKQSFRHFKPMLILFIPVVAISLYSIMDKIMLGSLSSKQQLGFYEASEKITTCMKSVIVAFGAVMMPRMTKVFADGDIKSGRRYMSLSMEIVMAAAFAMTFGISAVAHLFAPVFWGEEFLPCAALLIALGAALPFEASADVIRTQYLIPNNMDQAYILSVLLGGAANVAANFVLIPIFGALGAAAGTVLAEVTVWAVQCMFVRKKIQILRYLQKGLPFGAMGFVMFLAVRALDRIAQPTVLWLIVEVTVGAAVYCMLAALYLYGSKNELLMAFLKKAEQKLQRKKERPISDECRRSYCFWRRVQDVIFSLLALLALSPLMLLIALLVYIDDPKGSPIFTQTRCGKNGKPFRFYKFRSMYVDAEDRLEDLLETNEKDGPAFKMEEDPRVTRLGRMLRKTSLDELPQLVNILKGEMSIVGPRPALPREVALYNDYQKQRLSVMPGLTGYWQIKPHRDKIRFAEWVELDLKYIRERSFWVDWKIIILTVGAVVRGSGS